MAELVPGPISDSLCPGASASGTASRGAGFAEVLGISIVGVPAPCPGASGLVDLAGGEEEVRGDAWGCGGAGLSCCGDSSNTIGVSRVVLGSLPSSFQAFMRSDVLFPPTI